MVLWNGIPMYAPLTPEYYAIPGAQRCVFRIMQDQGDTQAWNLYWLSKPETDNLLVRKDEWFNYYHSLSETQTEAFYEALDTEVSQRLTLASVVALAPREAIHLLANAQLQKTRFYHLFGGEAWRQTMMGRLFLAARLERDHLPPPTEQADVVWIDFHTRHHGLRNGTQHRPG
ncbi:MAG: hypothetical protein QM776_11730 [Rhodocyclaceae bacterium]